MEDWLKCQISSLVKYRQNQKGSNFYWLEIETFCLHPSLYSGCTGGCPVIRCFNSLLTLYKKMLLLYNNELYDLTWVVI